LAEQGVEVTEESCCGIKGVNTSKDKYNRVIGSYKDGKYDIAVQGRRINLTLDAELKNTNS
jgi:penicillin-binding protein 2